MARSARSCRESDVATLVGLDFSNDKFDVSRYVNLTAATGGSGQVRVMWCTRGDPSSGIAPPTAVS
jgi:hypothetical protein